MSSSFFNAIFIFYVIFIFEVIFIIWSHFSLFGPVGPLLARFVPVGLFGLVWPWLGRLGPVWHHLAPFDSVYHCLAHIAPFGLFWFYLATFDPIWSHMTLSPMDPFGLFSTALSLKVAYEIMWFSVICFLNQWFTWSCMIHYGPVLIYWFPFRDPNDPVWSKTQKI